MSATGSTSLIIIDLLFRLRRDFEEKQRSIDEEKRSLTIKEQQIRQERDREVEQIRKDLEREFDERIK